MTRYLGTVLIADVFILRIVLAICSMLFALGLAVADTKGGAYNLMMSHISAPAWSALFILYSVLQLRIAFNRMSRWKIYVITLAGFAMWMTAFISFAENPNRHMGAADLILLFLPFCDLWTGANALSERRNAPRN